MAEESTGGRETILVVEDEEMVRELIARVLRQEGYRVVLARDGVEGLARAREGGGPFDLLLTDVVMPRKGGRALAEEMRRRQPDLRVLYMSGYTDRSDRAFELLESGVPFLQKPFKLAELSAAVRKMLDDAWEE